MSDLTRNQAWFTYDPEADAYYGRSPQGHLSFSSTLQAMAH
jgi:hypothetical protein